MITFKKFCVSIILFYMYFFLLENMLNIILCFDIIYFELYKNVVNISCSTLILYNNFSIISNYLFCYQLLLHI